jgi:hypothetical protein
VAPGAAGRPGPRPAPAPAGGVYILDQIQTGPLPVDVVQAMKPLVRMDEIESLLKSRSIAFAWRRAELDTAKADPKLTAQLQGLPPREPFVIGQPNGVIISVIVGQR